MMFRNGPKLEAIYEKGVIEEEHYQKSRKKKKGERKVFKAIITDKKSGQTTTVAKGSYEECAIKLSELRFIKYHKEWTYHNDTNIKGYIVGILTEEEVFEDDIETNCDKDELLREEEFHQESREKKKGEKKMDDKCLCCDENVAKGKQVCERCDVVDYEAWENYKLNNPSKVELHSKICNTLNDMYQKKNHDYGDSFAKLRGEIPDAILVRIYDKYSRLKTLMDGREQKVKDESINDTLMDLANYCIMELIEREMDNER